MPDSIDPSLHASGIWPIPAFSDNYIWAVVQNGMAAVIDPGQAETVRQFLTRHGLQLCAILLTHHHHDHVGGVTELRAPGGIPVYGPAKENLPHCDVRLGEGDQVMLPELELQLRVLDVPGHTAGHIAYYGHAAQHPQVLFCGDTLFAGGCGRLFEGTASQMLDSLGKFSILPEETEVFCAHEYTLGNLRWALAVDPANASLRQWYEQATSLREQNRPTLPSSIGKELASNPFLRTHHVDIAKAAALHAERTLADPVDVFAELREWKNTF